MTLRVLSLFSGIGGFDIGLEAAGMQTVAFCEKEPFCQAVLAHHWPGVKIYDDVTTLTADTLRRDGIACDVLAGGFPCQDVSFAGKRAGLEGTRSGLWSEVKRLAGEIRPRFVLLENVPGLLSLGMDRVLGDLSEIGYDAVWDCIPASAVGARHRRDRIWIIAHDPNARGRGGRADAAGYRLPAKQAVLQQPNRKARPDHDQAVRGDVADADSAEREARGPESVGGRSRGNRKGWVARDGSRLADTAGRRSPQQGNEGRDGQAARDREAGEPGGGGEVHVANASVQGLEVGERQRGVPRRAKRAKQGKDTVVGGHELPDADPAMREGRIEHGDQGGVSGPADGRGGSPESGLGRMVDGLQYWAHEPEGVPRTVVGQKGRANRLKALGNAIVPQVAYEIGKAVMAVVDAEHPEQNG